MTSVTAFDRLYAGVPDDQRDALRDFREAHPPRSVTVDGTEWTYFISGNLQNPPLLWLVGGLRVADAAHRYIPLLNDEFYIIAPDYPALSSMDDLADGLAGVLDAEDVLRAHVLGGSFGGMLAQVFVRRHPDRVKKIVLSTTSTPDDDEARRYQRQLDMITDTDDETLREAAQMQFYGILDPPQEKQAFYKAYLTELFQERLDRDDITSTFEALIDFMQREYDPDDLKEWRERLLLIDSSDDATFGEASRQAMYSLYPQARRYHFDEAGHSPASTSQEEYFDLVRTFLNE
jgi:pimeloyl-ACP methyl ester carboxylesterase